ncbi:hypothetical protein ACH5RR_009921 [Cinchona calisaya]|uniref:Retrotransposon Copia-like N-terminal domain-containing protein n=1 Tax=Cinchona calisaya TaxID=153742 RepID=A0ABD3AH77_9GENT
MTKYGMSGEKIAESSSDALSKAATRGNLEGTEGVQIPITNHKLNGNNYLQWSQSIKMFMCGRGKDEYLTGEIVPPKADDPNYRAWKVQNNLIMSWLVNSTTNDIGENFLLYDTAQEIWEAAKELYSSKENTSKIFEIESVLHDLRQGELNVPQYYGILTRYWQQLDVFEEYHWECPNDARRFKEIVEKKRIFKFLMGLNKNLDEDRGRILGMKPSPSIREVFSEVRKEESRKKVMMWDVPATSTVDQNSALAARGIQQEGNDNRTKKG